MQEPKALRLAELFDGFRTSSHAIDGKPVHQLAAAELRRLHALNAELVDALNEMSSMWVSVCNPRGWEPEHMSQFTKARAALSKAKES